MSKEKNVEELKIKKAYGEDMLQLCRDLFPTLIAQGILFDILVANFQENKYLSKDIRQNSLEIGFTDYINGIIEEEVVEKTPVDKTPTELMDIAGYDLFECKTEEEIQSFKHYYAEGEQLCTFRGGRLYSNYVFFAVKKNVDEIKREDFLEPDRQDEYGTSVLTIQFRRKAPNYIMVPNRYNHRVKNCNATFSNDLDNIIEGLNESFEKEYDLDFSKYITNFEIPNYVRAADGKFYRYNYEINGKYYCSNNTIIDDGEAIEYDKDKYLLVDYFLVDLENKSVSLYDENIPDDFVNHLKGVDKIEIKKLKTVEGKKEEKNTKEIIIKKKDGSNIAIKTNKYNQMTSLVADDITEAGDNFLYLNRYLSKISLASAKGIGDDFLYNNRVLDDINISSSEIVGDNFLRNNLNIDELDAPSLKILGNNFLFNNETLSKIKAPVLETLGNNFLRENRNLVKLILQSAKEIGSDALTWNKSLKELITPNLEIIEDSLLVSNRDLVKLVLTSAKIIGNNFLPLNEKLRKIDIPSARKVGDDFLSSNEVIDRINAPMLEIAGDNFFKYNYSLIKLDLPSAKEIGFNSLVYNEVLNEINAPLLENMGKFSFENHPLYSKMSTKEIREQSREYYKDKDKDEDAERIM